MNFLWSAAVDPSTPGFWTAVPSFGIAGACLIMAYFFLEYLKSEAKRQDEQDARRDGRYEEFTREQVRQMQEFVARQGDVIRDNAAAMREFRMGVNQICQASRMTGPPHERRSGRSGE